MKKFSYLLGMSLLSLSLVAGCSGEDPAPQNMGGVGGGGGGAPAAGGGSGGAAAGAATRTPTGMQLTGTSSYTILTGDNATASATPAPGYYGMVCKTCHGPAGEGVGTFGPEIRHTPATYSNYVVRNGRPSTLMTPYGMDAVPDATLLEIQNWLTAQPKPTTGQGLYLDFCGNCHGPMGGGGSAPWKAQGLPNATISMKVRSGVGTDPSMRAAYMPAFGTDILTDAELTLISQFLGGT
jgi:mono/diheme cytochrome c family protein